MKNRDLLILIGIVVLVAILPSIVTALQGGFGAGYKAPGAASPNEYDSHGNLLPPDDAG